MHTMTFPANKQKCTVFKLSFGIFCDQNILILSSFESYKPRPIVKSRSFSEGFCETEVSMLLN